MDFTRKLIKGIVIFENKKIEERHAGRSLLKGRKAQWSKGHGREIFTT